MKLRLFTVAITAAVLLCVLLAVLVAPAGSELLVKDPVSNFVGRASFYEPVKYKNLTIIPVQAPEHKIKTAILTLDEALSKDKLTIKEVDRDGSVNELAVWNNSDKFVFIMAGEILAGSKQDRILKKDVLLPPDSGKVIVSVFCVEHGRWTYKSDTFYSEEKAANISVRNVAQASKDQSAVWRDVAETNASVGAVAPTGSLSKATESEKVQKEKSEYIKEFVDIPSHYPKANGVVVLVNNKVLVADMFSDTHIFHKLWPKLNESYVLEAISRKEREVDSRISSAEEFLKLIQQADVQYNDYEGSGKSVEINSKYVTGTGVVKDSSPIHLGVFPKIEIKEKPVDIPPIYRNYNDMQQRQTNEPPQ